MSQATLTVRWAVIMNELALFAGAGGGILGGKLIGWDCVCAVENDPYAIGVLVSRQNDGSLSPFPIWDDIRTFDGRRWRGAVDVVSGGFPCQGFSCASRGRAVAENLWPEMLRVVGEVRPRYVFCENVSEDAICEAQADLEDCGFSTDRVRIDATHLGADHHRRRWWCLADADDKSELVGPQYAEVERVAQCGARIWEAKPCDPRMDDGMAGRVDRFKAIGNGQVPIMAALAWATLARSSHAHGASVERGK